MKVLIFEDNLIWSTRLVRTVRGLGHEAEVVGAAGTIPGQAHPLATDFPHPPTPSPRTTHRGEGELPEAQVAIVNLGSPALLELVPKLRAAGIYVIGHAGHKEKELHALGKDAGCDRLATNSEITWKLGEILGGVGC